MRLFWRVPASTTLKLGRATCSYGKRYEGCRFYPSRKHDSTIITTEQSNHTSTETKAEQLDGIVIRHAAHTASRNDNERLLYYWNKPLQQYLIHDQNQWIISIIFLHSSYAE
jgi:hypothetical protein